jgi:hypothetical protein
MGSIFRTQEQLEKYKAYIAAGGLDTGCVLCSKSPIKTFTYWKVIPNDFPYDLVAKTHHMLIPFQHVAEKNLSEDEWKEFQLIKGEYLQQYDYIIEATEKQKSIPQHFHLHLITKKD